MTIRVAIADHHPVVLDGLECLFRSDSQLEVVARCGSGENALKAVREERPDILVLDVHIPHRGGLAVLRQMKEEQSATRAVIFASSISSEETLEAMRLGTHGIVLKDMPTSRLLMCVHKVHAGEDWIERSAFTAVSKRSAASTDPAAFGTTLLTAHESKVMELVAEGLRNKEIARRLSITEGTVKSHLHSVYKKVGVNGRMALALLARNREAA